MSSEAPPAHTTGLGVKRQKMLHALGDQQKDLLCAFKESQKGRDEVTAKVVEIESQKLGYLGITATSSAIKYAPADVQASFVRRVLDGEESRIQLTLMRSAVEEAELKLRLAIAQQKLREVTGESRDE